MQPETKSVGLYTHIRNNNMTSAFLMFMFPFSVILIIWSIGFGWDLYLGYLEKSGQKLEFGVHTASSPIAAGVMAVMNYGLFALIACFVWVGVAASFHEKLIDMATGSKTITRSEYPELYNLLENLCISRGLKMPKLGIIKSDALNAFASGVSEKSYRIVVTKSLLETLDKNELEAVLGHELTHIMNKDVRTMIIATVFVGMISFISEMLWRSMRHARFGSSRRSGKGGKSAGVLILISAVALAIGYLFALLVRFSLSRTREYLADAGAVELTKNPGALASALRKISGNPKLDDVPDEVRQMFIENPPVFSRFFSTHPPVEERIRILESLGGRYSSGRSFIGNGVGQEIENIMTSGSDMALSDSSGLSPASDSPWSTRESHEVSSIFDTPKNAVGSESSGDAKAFLDSVDSANPEFAPQRSFFKSPWAFLALILLLIGGGLMFAGFMAWNDEVAFASHGRVTSGRVESLWTSRSNDSTDYHVKFNYADENMVTRTGSCKVSNGVWRGLSRGGMVQVQYLPGGGKSRVHGSGLGKMGAAAFAGLGMLLLIGAVYLPYNFQRRIDVFDKLKASGMQTSGKIKKVDTSAMTINNKPYTKIEYEYVDNHGITRQGKTRYLRLSLANDFKLGAKIKVFYDPQNPKRNISEIG